MVRGFDPRKYSVEDLAMLHLGVQTYVANQQGRQDRKGNMLGAYRCFRQCRGRQRGRRKIVQWADIEQSTLWPTTAPPSGQATIDIRHLRS